jgi:release factor glutamine methyltransferase
MSITEAYERGQVTFMGVEVAVARGALVPRAETELLGETALRTAREHEHQYLGGPRIVDMCCGAGNLACALAMRLPLARVWASDLTDGCVTVARKNVARLGLEDRVAVHQGDLFASLIGRGLEGSIDLIVCNPPYISEKRLSGDRAALLAAEPREAFDGGPYGLSIHQRVIKDALAYLRPGGWLLFEFGLGQERQLELLFGRSKAYEDVRVVANASAEPRVIAGRKRVSA